MHHQGLFAYLADRFSGNTEDLATEALCYLLRYAEADQDAQPIAETFIRYAGTFGASLEQPIHFSTQEGHQDNGQPDLWGRDEDGKAQLLIECKFWAGLTKHQPTSYLNILREDDGQLLLFIVPEARRRYVWAELRTRLGIDPPQTEDVESWSLCTAEGPVMAITTWGYVLDAMRAGAQASPTALADLEQLEGLCARMDRDAFIPLAGEDVGPNVAQRIHDYQSLVRDLRKQVKHGFADGWGPVGDCSPAHWGYRFPVRLHGLPAYIGLQWWWKERGHSPIWIRLTANSSSHRTAILSALKSKHVAYEDWGDHFNDLLIPLRLPLAVERDHVIRLVTEQMRFIAEGVDKCNPPTG